MAGVDTSRIERDMRVFMAGLRHYGIPPDRAHHLARLANDRAAALAGPPSSMAWFGGWAEVLREQGTEAENEAARNALTQVKKLWDAGY